MDKNACGKNKIKITILVGNIKSRSTYDVDILQSSLGLLDGIHLQELIQELVNLLERSGGISDPRRLTEEVLDRERMASTGIGSGIAIPHALSTTASRTMMAFGLKLDGAKFDAVDNQPVSLFFLIVGPENDHIRHLQILSRIARYLHDPEFCRKLREACCAEDVVNAFHGKEPL